jgi:hypothetical protein
MWANGRNKQDKVYVIINITYLDSFEKILKNFLTMTSTWQKRKHAHQASKPTPNCAINIT